MKCKKRVEIRQKDCVACGCCAAICQRNAMYIKSGLYAKVNSSLCVGCGLCVKECPASVIELKAVQT